MLSRTVQSHYCFKGVGRGGSRGFEETPFDRLVSNTSYKALPAWPVMLQLQLYIAYHLQFQITLTG